MGVVFIKSKVKVCALYYRDILLSQQILAVVKHYRLIVDNNFVFQPCNALAYDVCSNVTL